MTFAPIAWQGILAVATCKPDEIESSKLGGYAASSKSSPESEYAFALDEYLAFSVRRERTFRQS
jgi:hypothetical protein